MAISAVRSATQRRAVDVRRLASALKPLPWFFVIGVEIAVLAVYLPETVRTWWSADATGDFPMFFEDARELAQPGLYGPALSLLLHPLTYLGLANAYRAYVALGALAALAVAFLAQRQVSSIEGKAAVVLGILSLPQLHWALRFGHMTAFLALAALGGFLLLRKRPVLAGLCFAFLVIKPQYAALPGLYLLWTRNSRALAAMIAGAALLEFAGFAAVGFDSVGTYVHTFVDWSGDARDNLLPVQQAWQYAWPGFLISLGLEPHPLVVFDLLLLSLGAVVLVWTRGERSAGPAAAAFGMLLVTPYSNFYDWALLAVAAALVLRAELPGWRVLPLFLVGLYVAMLASMAATPWPDVDVTLDVAGTQGHFFMTPGETSAATGVYWVTPVALATVAVLALASHRTKWPRRKRGPFDA
jgi:hypothetical protein